MIARYNRISLAWGLSGALLQLVALTYVLIKVSAPGPPHTRLEQVPDIVMMLVVTVLSVGTVFVMIGLAYYAKAKGRDPAWCIMGFFLLLGLLVLACLPDDFERGLELRCRACNDWNHKSANFCNNCGAPL
jgi:hypothetical protein